MSTIKWFLDLLYLNSRKKYIIYCLLIALPMLLLIKYLSPLTILYMICISLSVVYNRILFQEFVECNPLVVLILYKDIWGIIVEMILRSIKRVAIATLCALPVAVIVATILNKLRTLSFVIILDIVLFTGLILVQLVLHMQLLFLLNRFLLKMFDGILLAANSVCINFYNFRNFHLYGYSCLMILFILTLVLPKFINKEKFVRGGE